MMTTYRLAVKKKKKKKSYDDHMVSQTIDY